MPTREEVEETVNGLLTPGGSGDRVTAVELRAAFQALLDYVDQEVSGTSSYSVLGDPLPFILS